VKHPKTKFVLRFPHERRQHKLEFRIAVSDKKKNHQREREIGQNVMFETLAGSR
jgi:hypothetical protein